MRYGADTVTTLQRVDTHVGAELTSSIARGCAAVRSTLALGRVVDGYVQSRYGLGWVRPEKTVRAWVRAWDGRHVRVVRAGTPPRAARPGRGVFWGRAEPQGAALREAAKTTGRLRVRIGGGGASLPAPARSKDADEYARSSRLAQMERRCRQGSTAQHSAVAHSENSTAERISRSGGDILRGIRQEGYGAGFRRSEDCRATSRVQWGCAMPPRKWAGKTGRAAISVHLYLHSSVERERKQGAAQPHDVLAKAHRCLMNAGKPCSACEEQNTEGTGCGVTGLGACVHISEGRDADWTAIRGRHNCECPSRTRSKIRAQRGAAKMEGQKRVSARRAGLSARAGNVDGVHERRRGNDN
ncbi:hypothetical protein BV25DRAFT_601022 [Artomyces pyxidatus]|uniref:Uncharacterized protein n=1 Tax=Artomyces pyxidatus TaxID=48021 RepID=A0ACB8T3C4_9AGAM|nr:hypothetical protein BV25DRAFT_601022 [Artomyces pyxidatus]